jgi:ribosome-associated heat shock protein Hsp15
MGCQSGGPSPVIPAITFRGMQRDEGETHERVRLDKWLWAARFFKTRALAAEAIDGGKVEVNDARAKRAKMVQLGDAVRVRQTPFEHVVIVRGISDRRGPASVAATLYEETAESKTKREALATQIRSMPADDWETGRPTKRDRREIERFKRR